jgi:hypothetical protein
MRYRLRTLLLLLALGPVILWSGYRIFSRPMPAKSISTSAEFHATMASGKTIIHLDVDWAMQAVRSRRVIEQLEQSVAIDPRLDGVMFRRIDCSNQEDGPVWNTVSRWLETRSEWRSLLYGGYGALIWVENGQVKDSVINAAELGDDALFARTLAAFGEK